MHERIPVEFLKKVSLGITEGVRKFVCEALI